MEPKTVDKRISRRTLLLGLGAGASTLVFAGCASQSAAPAPAPTATPQPTGGAPAASAPTATPAPKFDWKMAQGQQMRFIGLKSFVEDYWEQSVPEFEALTGAKVRFEAYEQAQARQKIATELTAGTGTLDTFRTTRGQDFAQYWTNGWYEVLDPYIADPAKTSPDLDLPDFFEGSLNACKIDGKVIALPVTNGGQCLFVRKDLLDAKGLKTPTNFDELEQVAKAVHNPPNVYGFVSRGQKSAAVSMFAVFLHNMGADWMGEDGKTPSLDTPEAIEAYRFYGGLLRDYGPPGITNMTHVDLHPLFAQGKAALYPDDVGARLQFEDAAKSAVKGKVHYAKFPAGPKRNTPTIYVYGMAVSSQSKNKDAAWLWVQFVSGKEYQTKAMAAGVAAGRKSSWEDPAGVGEAPQDWVETTQWTFAAGDDEWAPPVISVPEARDIVGLPITVAIEGGDVKAACIKANNDLTALAKRDGVI